MQEVKFGGNLYNLENTKCGKDMQAFSLFRTNKPQSQDYKLGLQVSSP